MRIFGIPVVVDFTPPPTEGELEEAGENYTQLKADGYGGTPENDEFEAAMNQAGYMPSWNRDEHRFTFVPLTFCNGE